MSGPEKLQWGRQGSCLPSSVSSSPSLGKLRKCSFSVFLSFSDHLKSWLRDSQCPLEVISPAVETLQKLCHAYADVLEEAQV